MVRQTAVNRSYKGSSPFSGAKTKKFATITTSAQGNMEKLGFFKTKDKLGFCSNFSKHKVNIYNNVWFTSEHAYQSCKFHDENVKSKILLEPSPMKAALIGRDISNKIRCDWDSFDKNQIPNVIVKVKDRFMFDVVRAKFEQHPDILSELKKTKGIYLYENTSSSNDYYWGEVSDSVGENRLGHIIMYMRDNL